MDQSWCVRMEMKIQEKLAMNKFALFIVFLSGALFAVIIGLCSKYANPYTFEYEKEQYLKTLGNRRGIFSVLPDASQLQVFDENIFGLSDFGLVLKKSELAKRASTELENSSLETEALGSLHAALEMKRNGKSEKALKLFQHAMVLCPKHPDILVHYGEFLEDTQKDVLAADHLYLRALTFSPKNSRAFENRQRTIPLVEEMDANQIRRIEKKRDALVQIPDSSSALTRVKKEAYFQNIYHTVGLEGNTMTLSQTRLIVETRMAVAGKSIVEHNEILGLDAALKYINTTLVHKVGAISLRDILEIHRRVMGFVDPIDAGSFRRTQVYVGDHVPPGPTKLSLLMDEFIEWLNSERALRMHPIKFAALAHYKLVFIHPFCDGNGRTSRLLMNLILMQAGYPPIIIRKQDRQKYYEHLELANEGDIRPFIRFIAECTERTLDVYLWATTEYATEVPALAQKEDDGRTIIVEDSIRPEE